MRATIEIEVSTGSGTDTRYRKLRSEAPLSLRPTDEALFLVSSAAALVGGDAITVSIALAENSRLTVRSAGATLVRPANVGGAPAKLAINVNMEPGSTFLWLPEATVIQKAALLDSVFELNISGDAAALVREDLVFGRYGENCGSFSTSWRASRDGEPLYRSVLSNAQPGFKSWAVAGPFRSYRQIAVLGTRFEHIPAHRLPNVPTAYGLPTAQALCRLERGGYLYQGMSEELMDLAEPARSIERFFLDSIHPISRA